MNIRRRDGLRPYMNRVKTVAREGWEIAQLERGKGVRHGQWMKQARWGVINSRTEATCDVECNSERTGVSWLFG